MENKTKGRVASLCIICTFFFNVIVATTVINFIAESLSDTLLGQILLWVFIFPTSFIFVFSPIILTWAWNVLVFKKEIENE